MPSLSVKFSSMAAVNPVKNRGQKAVPTATKKTMMKKGTAVAKTTRAARGAKTKTSKRAMKGVKAVLKKKGGPNENATRKTDQPSLDFEMDKYWFKVGKGPDPTAMKLDREIERYRSLDAPDS